VTSNPVSGLTIATLLGTSVIFWLMGWTDIYGKATALMIGTVVCIAASISGDMSQDLKTGYLLGATPYRQQLGELLGALTSAFFICWTVQALHESLEIGSENLRAPQATLMKLVIDGVIQQSLPWGLIFIGIGLTALVIIVRLPALPFAVGVYLPLSTMAPVFLGGMVRYFLTRKQSDEVVAERREKGVLFASGLVGGEGLMGVGLALAVFATGGRKITGISGDWPEWILQAGALLSIVAILYIIARAATRRTAASSEPPA
jgi:putative OPT family oligopeptide transporter